MTRLQLNFKRFCRSFACFQPLAALVPAAIAMCLLSYGCATTGPDEGVKAEQISVEELAATPRVVDFVLGPGDEVEVMVWRNEDLHLVQRISPYGMLHYPLAGDIRAAGMSISELRDTITEGLAPYVVDPQVTVNVATYVNQKIFVLGEVVRPGVFSLIGPMTAIEAVSAAEGFTLDAASNSVVLIRGGADKPQLALLDIRASLEGGAMGQNVLLRGGDIIYVPSSPVADVNRFFVRLRDILLPIVTLETGIILYPLVEDALKGESTRAVVTTGR